MDNIFSDLEIVIIGNKRKKVITTDFLQDIPHRIFYTTDYDLPKDFEIDQRYLKYFSTDYNFILGAYRCFRGHQDALNSCEKNNILIFEDDASVKDNNWKNILPISIELLKKFDIVSLHGRQADISKFKKIEIEKNIFYYNNDKHGTNNNFVLGSLSYILSKKTAKDIINYQFIGCPMDIYICNYFNFCFLNPSPFLHDRRYGSLVES